MTTTDDAYCWGSTGGGALRNGTLTSSNVPVAVLGELAFQSVTTGGPLSCGVTTAGAAYCGARTAVANSATAPTQTVGATFRFLSAGRSSPRRNGLKFLLRKSY